jgi:hypothetical protein
VADEAVLNIVPKKVKNPPKNITTKKYSIISFFQKRTFILINCFNSYKGRKGQLGPLKQREDICKRKKTTFVYSST